MASSFSALLALELMATGENENTWGDKTNDNLEKLGRKIAGRLAITLASSNYTLTSVNGGDGSGSTNPANLILDCTGTLTSDVDIIIPNTSAMYIVRNGTTQTASETVGIRTAGGSAYDVPNGESQIVFCDGSNNVYSLTATTSGTVATATNALQLGGVVAASYARLAVKQAWTKPQYLTPTHVSLTSNAYTPNADDDSHIVVDQSEIGASDVTINNPTGTPVDGQVLIVDIEQHGTTPVSVIWGSKFIFPDDTNLDLTQTADVWDGFAFQYSNNLDRWVGKGAAQNLPRT